MEKESLMKRFLGLGRDLFLAFLVFLFAPMPIHIDKKLQFVPFVGLNSLLGKDISTFGPYDRGYAIFFYFSLSFMFIMLTSAIIRLVKNLRNKFSNKKSS